jgi:hypothetical protein
MVGSATLATAGEIPLERQILVNELRSKHCKVRIKNTTGTLTRTVRFMSSWSKVRKLAGIICVLVPLVFDLMLPHQLRGTNICAARLRSFCFFPVP